MVFLDKNKRIMSKYKILIIKEKESSYIFVSGRYSFQAKLKRSVNFYQVQIPRSYKRSKV